MFERREKGKRFFFEKKKQKTSFKLGRAGFDGTVWFLAST
jgi:hypothetical protein